MKRTMLASTVVFALSLVLAAVPVNQALAAACGPIDLSGSDWNLAGSMKVSVKKVGKVNQSGQVDLGFTGSGSSYWVVDPENDGFTGTYTFDAKGKMQLKAKPIPLQGYIEDKIESMAAAAGHVVVYGNLRDISHKASIKVKSAKTGIALSVSIRIKATADISVDGQPEEKTKISISLKAKGTKVMSVASSRWWLATKYKASVKGLGKVSYPGTLDVILGPNASEGVAAGEFKAIDGLSREFTGSYSETKGRVTIDLNWVQLADFLEDLIEIESEGSVLNVSVAITKATGIAKVKHAMSATMKLSVKFKVTGIFEGTPVSSKGSYAQKGKGCATEYEL